MIVSLSFSDHQTTDGSNKSEESNVGTMVGIVVTVCLLLIIVIIAFIFYYRKTEQEKTQLKKVETSDQQQPGYVLMKDTGACMNEIKYNQPV